MFPYYLSIGMTCEQFWDDDVELVKFYREAWRLKQKARNQELWLQGAYIYEAILAASPVLHDFVKRGTKPIPYREQPYALFEKEKALTKEEKSDRKAKAVMEMLMVSINKKFEKKDGEDNGG